MPKLVDADEFKRIAAGCVFETPKGIRIKAEIAIDARPAVDAEPVRHAYWEPSEVGEYHCTNCGVECDIDEFHKALLNSFCGNCGARMDATDTNVGGKGDDDND